MKTLEQFITAAVLGTALGLAPAAIGDQPIDPNVGYDRCEDICGDKDDCDGKGYDDCSCNAGDMCVETS